VTEFCPQCGTARLGAFRFCQGCRLDFDTIDATPAAAVSEPDPEAASTQTYWIAPVTATPKARRPLRRYVVVGVVALLGLGTISTLANPQPDQGAPTQPSAPPVAAATSTPTVSPVTPAPTAVPTELAFGPTGETQLGTVTRIVDGDTIRVKIDGVEYPVRYIGMDTPEPDAKDAAVKQLADAATAANSALLNGHDVILERDVSETDNFDRLLRHVWIEGDAGEMVLINLKLIQLGFAQVSTYPPDVKYVELLTAAQETARTAATGLWAPAPTPAPTPSPTPSPAPTAPPEVAVDDDPLYIAVGDRERFEGRVGQYTWGALAFEESQMTVRWSASASSKGDCRVVWRILPSSGDGITRAVDVEAGQSTTGNRRFNTSFADAAFVVNSTCGVWKMSMEGYVPPPKPTPAPPSGGGGGGGSCHPSYKGACLKVGAGDYDCASGSGNGPNYVSGPISVVGYDEFDLDRDGDGVGCENG
jgi:micrococcal nuclease